MAKLQHLYGEIPKPGPMQLIEGFLGQVSTDVARQISQAIGDDVAASARAVEAVQVALFNLAPKLEKVLAGAIAEAGRDLRKELDKLASDMKERTITQKDMVKLQGDLVRALSNVKIPDYTAALERLEAREVDLGPLLEKLDNLTVELPEEERADTWHFDIKRDRNGLIESVTATEA